MRWIFIVWLLTCNVSFAQVSDNFSDNDFSNNPQWYGSTDKFRVETASGMLQLFAPAVDGEAWLFTGSKSIENAVWQFRLRMGFNPSSTNYAQVYLATENSTYPNLGSSFYLVLGTTADNIALWERKGGTSKKLIDGLAGRLNLSIVDVRIRVTRKKGGLFILECNLGSGWIEEGRFAESTGFESSHMGLSCHYTSTRSTLFHFDDFDVRGDAFYDTIPPAISHFEVKNKYKLFLRFTKPVNKLILNQNNFKVEPGSLTPEMLMVDGDNNAVELLFRNGIPTPAGGVLQIRGVTDIYGNALTDSDRPFTYNPTIVMSTEVPDVRTIKLCFSRAMNASTIKTNNFTWTGAGPEIISISDAGQNCYVVTFNSDLPNGQIFQLNINNVTSTNGDTIANGPYPVFYYLPSRNDIVITEIMPDPSPPVLLPDSEYIELYNRCLLPIQLSGYKIGVGTKESALGPYLLYPNEYVVLVPSTLASQWASVPNKISVTSWPTLANTGGDIVLRDKTGKVMTSVRYGSSMGASGFKQEGGWSFEIKDPDNLSGDRENWGFSVNEKGGTPGFKNSVASGYPDIKAPLLTGTYIKSRSCVVMEFSEPIDFINGQGINGFEISPPGLNLVSFKPDDIFLMQAEICFSEELADAKIYNLNFKSIPFDLAGNSLSSISYFNFGWPVKAEQGDIIINELLFDPPTGGSDFLELYNPSEKLIDLSEIFISRINSEGNPEKLIKLSQEKRLFFPKSYMVFTADRDWLLRSYSIDNDMAVKSLSDMPNYLTPSGSVFVADLGGQIIDRFDYTDKFHFSLLATKKGVSLERINAGSPTQDKSNWHSASAESGYGTPGKINSQAVNLETVQSTDYIKIEPEIFYPNQDGFNDLLLIRYLFKKPGNTCTVKIFNREGKLVRNLINNQLTGIEGFFTWDGLTDTGARCNSGIYVIWISSFNLDGDVSEVKKVAVIGSGRP